MKGDAAASAMGFVAALGSTSATWPDAFWAGLVAWVDAILRSYYGIYEFTDDPRCVLRVGLGEARAPVSLSDGTYIWTSNGGPIVTQSHSERKLAILL
jgi:hypothetical protein